MAQGDAALAARSESAPGGPGDDMRRRAAAGALTLGARNLLGLALSLLANLVLARLLSPADFGLVAIGSVLIVGGRVAASGGLGADLVRRSKPPTKDELRAVQGVELLAALGLAALGCAVALPFGRGGAVAALILAALPFFALRGAATIVLMRSMAFGRLALVDLVDVVAYCVWAVASVVAGLGVWGMASAVVVQALAGTVAMARVAPGGLWSPKPSWSLVRPLIGFGTRIQVAGLIPLVRDQILSVAIAAVAGVSALGLWSLAYRALQVPLAVSNALFRVAFPTLARMPRPATAGALEREVAIVAVATGAIGAGLAAAGPSLLPALVGERWEPVAPALLWTGIGIVLGTPGYVVGFGWLASADRAESVLRISGAQALGSLVVALPLLSPLGATAAGLAWLVHSIVGAWLCDREVRRDTGARMARAVVLPVGAYLIAALAGYGGAKVVGSSLTAGAGVVIGTEVVALGVLILFPSGRGLLRESARLTRRAVRDATRPEDAPLLPT